MVRHGESDWNRKNLFCGWYDAKLSLKGAEEAVSAGKTLKELCYQFDIAHTSVLKRAKDTLSTILNQVEQTNIPVHSNWRLNERHYGGLTGLNKSETAKKYGEDKVKLWRRSFDIPPPPMEVDHPYYDHIKNSSSYTDGPSECEFPTHESLKMTIERTLPYWDSVIVPQIKKGCRIIIAAHGNSLRGIIKHLDNISDEGIMGLNLPTGIPFEYTLDENLKPLVSMKFLGDEETVKKAMDSVASQGKAK
ncbi:PREDICTED: phosphoglycerate mutase 2-like [Diuraphis noxia]|uniref:phosphoglycerate mutase 2-like n=1 Tax=Diuraphis noxia TaxID=143948 RepID=UPI0007635EEB|nr:PREDICTED: phosphoglycerate mutase 2-like [Diuraphis noxia]